MTIFKKFFLFTAVFAIPFFCVSAEIDYDKNAEKEKGTLESIFFTDFDDDSYFVTIPTYTGNYLGLVIGAAPAAIVAGGFQFANMEPNQVRESARVTLAVFSKSVGLLFGLPFKLIRIVAWDAPVYIYGGFTGDTDPPLSTEPGKRPEKDY